MSGGTGLVRESLKATESCKLVSHVEVRGFSGSFVQHLVLQEALFNPSLVGQPEMQAGTFWSMS